MSKIRLRKDVREVVRYAEQHGYEYQGIRKSGHLKLKNTRNGHCLSLPASPSCHYWTRNAQADIRRYSRG